MANVFEIKIPKIIAEALRLPQKSSKRNQQKVLKKLLSKARFTELGQEYNFDKILLQENIEESFQQNVPIFDYNAIYNRWWKRSLAGIPDVTWPGKIKYYALSSGTSEASSKYIPITKELLRSNTINYLKQFISFLKYDNVSYSAMTKGFLMLGGGTDLEKGQAGWYAGDLSGILAKKRPFWFQTFYKPGHRIAAIKDWNHKINEIVLRAKSWDIGFVVGVPAWCQMCLEKVIEHYKLNNIHEIWPNFQCFVHGGVSFEPYKKGFEKLLGKPIIYIENYLASEGFIGYKSRENAKGMRLILDNNIFMEFVPFDHSNFDENYNIKPNAKALLIDEVQENKEYALLITTNSGVWRYLIGDTIRFVDLANREVIITGRTKHFLSLVGEHLSIENITKAVEQVSNELNISIPEFTVTGFNYNNFFAHKWYIATNDNIDGEMVRQKIDAYLCKINDDYATERTAVLKEVFLEVLPEKKFMEFMESKGKIGSQHKFPRVMKGKMLDDWLNFLNEKK